MFDKLFDMPKTLFYSFALIIICFCCTSKSNVKEKKTPLTFESHQSATITHDFTSLDSVLDIYDNLDKLNQENSKNDDLGFGYSVIEKGFGFINTSLRINFLIDENQKIISSMYELFFSSEPNSIPQNLLDSLQLRGFFLYRNGEIKKYRNFQHSVRFISNEIRYENVPSLDSLISPWSGYTYGSHCGFGGIELENRKRFKQLGNLRDETIRLLLNSINPATRLMAVEYLCNNLFIQDKSNYIQEVLKSIQEPKLVTTCSGCIYSSDSPVNALHPNCNNSSFFQMICSNQNSSNK